MRTDDNIKIEIQRDSKSIYRGIHDQKSKGVVEGW